MSVSMACETTEDRAMPAGHSLDPAQWRGLLDAGLARVAGRFARVEPLRTVAAPFGGHRQVELSGGYRTGGGGFVDASARLPLPAPTPTPGSRPTLEAINRTALGIPPAMTGTPGSAPTQTWPWRCWPRGAGCRSTPLERRAVPRPPPRGRAAAEGRPGFRPGTAATQPGGRARRPRRCRCRGFPCRPRARWPTLRRGREQTDTGRRPCRQSARRPT